MPPKRRLGKRPALHDLRVPRLAALMRDDEPPDQVNWYAAVGEWPMLANDQLGDCVEAAALHLIQQRAAYVGRDVAFSDADAVALYQSWAGYDPGDANTDRGTVLSAALAQWRTSGVLVGADVHHIESYAAVWPHPGSAWLRRAIWRCGAVLVGFGCRESWLTSQYLLDGQDGDAIAGQHCALLVGYEPTVLGIEYDCITWGARFRATERALLPVLDEAYAVLSHDWYDAAGHDPASLDWAQASEAMRSLTA